MRTPPPDFFVTTRWTMVLAAGRTDSVQASRALAELCQTYWYPLYAYARKRGYDPHHAEDVTQGFFARLLKLHSLSGLSRERGRFRAFLLASMKHYLADEWDRASAQKRDVRQTLSLDAQAAEHRYHCEPAHDLTPDRLFERQWALTLLESVVRRLAREYDETGRGDLFAALRFTVAGDSEAHPYAELADQLGMTGEAVRVAVHRLRRRYRVLLREEIGQTVADESEIAAELQDLMRILAS